MIYFFYKKDIRYLKLDFFSLNVPKNTYFSFFDAQTDILL